MMIVRFSRVWWAVLGMGHPLVRWSLQMMTQDGGMTAQLQGDHEGCRGSTTKLGGMWKIESKHINLRTRIKRLVRRTICFSKTERMHDLVIGLFVNRYEFGRPI